MYGRPGRKGRQTRLVLFQLDLKTYPKGLHLSLREPRWIARATRPLLVHFAVVLRVGGHVQHHASHAQARAMDLL